MPEGGRYPHLVRAIRAAPWLIDEDSFEWAAMLDVLEMRMAGERFSEDEIRARIDAAAGSHGPRAGGTRAGAVAVIPIYGVITPRANMMTSMSGGTTAEDVRGAFQAALADGDVTAIVLDVDSPGGNVEGIEETATVIREARGEKPIVAVANHVMASAAYYLGAQADEVVITPSGRAGSIGIVTAHTDVSAAQEKLGVKTTLISAGKFKTEGHGFAPLTDDDKAAIQRDVETYYGMFVRAVAKGRGVSADAVRSGFGEGRMLIGGAAVDAGLADRVDTFDNTIRRAARGSIASRKAAGVQASADLDSDDQADEPELDGEADGPDLPSTPDRVVPARRAQRLLRMAARERGHYIGPVTRAAEGATSNV
jgi:signal peptide peptidase SppA